MEEYVLNEWIYFATFTFFITVVLMNLLIAIIGDTYVRVMATKEMSQNAQLCDIVLEFETFLFWRRLSCCGKAMKVEPEHLVFAEYEKLEVSSDFKSIEGRIKDQTDPIYKLLVHLESSH